jgi:predicted DNA-binding transcriptional regulator YafY
MYHIDQTLWNTIVAGLRENRVITFDYQSTWSKPYENRAVRPWQMLFDNGVWYLYGYSEERSGARMFSLSRMKNPAVTQTPFTYSKSCSYCKKNDGSYFGVYSGERWFHFRVKFTGDFVLWAKERQWAADQKAEDVSDGVIIDFTSTQYGKVLEWVLSKGAYAEPLEPHELVEDWQQNIAEMQKLAKKSR